MGSMKRLLALLAALCLILGLAACSASSNGQGQTENAAEETITFLDDLGRSVTVPYQPQRVAVLIGSFAHVWTLAGGSLVATANDAWTEFDLDLDDSVVNLGTTTNASLELLLSVDPDFVIASCNTQLNLDWQNTLENAQIATAYFDVNTFDDYLRMLEICTRITGREDLYAVNGTDIQAQVDAAIASVDGSHPTVLYLRATASSVKAKGSSGNVLGEMLRDLGCINIADNDSNLLDSLSLEAILAADPDYIFVVRQGSDAAAVEESLSSLVTSNAAWGTLTAIQEGRYYEMDPKLFNLKPNNRWGEAYEILAQILFGVS